MMKLMVLFLAFFSGLACAQGPLSGSAQREVLVSEALPATTEPKLTAVEVVLPPNSKVGSHRHEGFVYVYVLEGSVLSQLDNQQIVKYEAGDSWTEPPGALHSLTHNQSNTSTARLLAVFIASDGAKLTTSGAITDKSK
jgi:quercetin dioxygenase-like cupin family protein